ncbi:UvrD-helicase domain-containing protein [Tenacibaculum mesophilum]|uniref:UvrD-helicase domain-containing protein n=1 Tax=Tenacibaculum mesophilum TaxID=104268 RepID=UPI00248FB8B5|nr:UvrD-helicase domain-containing protein [Tenacibaculum mesophilum]
MPQEINITNADIEYAEKVLLPEGKEFDEERRLFIRNLETLDLQAVPGSGKTTALLAKLLILERYMPLKNGRGVLVISHTNAAVDEIKERIGKHCPKLFAYPNFVGTIQSFVDTFLAIPYSQNFLKTRLYRIESERFQEELWYQFSKIYWNNEYEKPGTYLFGRLINKAKAEAKKSGRTVKQVCDDLIKKDVQNLYFDFRDEKIKFFRDDGVLLSTKTNKKYQGIKETILKVLYSGVISYEYAYKLADYYLEKVPRVKSILLKRFQYVFVDEMQDMDSQQNELIENIFEPTENVQLIIQRVGDVNQAIYNARSLQVENIWSIRENVMYINGSHRLSPRIAQLVQNLALTPNPVEGRNLNPDGSAIDIKPTIFVYEDDTIELVIPSFAEKIKELQASNSIPVNPTHKFMAVAWRKKHDDDDKVGLSDYWPQFAKASSGQQIDFKVLEDYILYFNKEKKNLESVRKNVLNALLKVLRLENVLDENDRVYTKRKLINFFKTLENNEYENLKLNLYKWSIECIRGKSSDTITAIRDYIPSFLSIFQKEVTLSVNFINGESEINTDDIEDESQKNTFDSDEVSIEIGTVHSAKGQTHTATLYLETFYNRGYGYYESERLRNQLKGVNITDTLNSNIGGKDKIRQTCKMAYVGFSRPTHLLCIAIHKERFDSILSDINDEDWNIVEVKTK